MNDARLSIINTNGSKVIVGDFSSNGYRIYTRNGPTYSFTSQTLKSSR